MPESLLFIRHIIGRLFTKVKRFMITFFYFPVIIFLVPQSMRCEILVGNVTAVVVRSLPTALNLKTFLYFEVPALCFIFKQRV